MARYNYKAIFKNEILLIIYAKAKKQNVFSSLNMLIGKILYKILDFPKKHSPYGQIINLCFSVNAMKINIVPYGKPY